MADLHRKKSLARGGFTLIELLVTMVLSSIVLIAIYMMLSSSSEVFHHQELTADNQDTTRFATELLKNDISRAGFQGSPNAAADPDVCPAPSFNVRAVQIIEDQTITSPSITYDALVVVGNMTSYEPFTVSGLAATTVTLDTAMASATFLSVFKAPRIVRVTNPDGVSQFAKVTSADGTAHTVTLGTSITQASNGSCGYMPMAGENHEVTPVIGYLYRLEVDPLVPAAELKTDLVRYEVDFSGASATTVAGTRLVVAEYVVGLNFVALGIPSGQTTPGVAFETNAETQAMNDDTASTTSVLTDVNTRPQAARYLMYRIKTRTRRAVPRRLAAPSSLTTGTAEDVFFDLGGSKVAEIRSIQGKIELPNLGIKGLN